MPCTNLFGFLAKARGILKHKNPLTNQGVFNRYGLATGSGRVFSDLDRTQYISQHYFTG
jgi:hypothetical protein